VKHFSDECLADFVRDMAPSTTKMAIEDHIADGCAQCVMALATWGKVFSLAQAEFELTPPNDIVRVVKSQFAGEPSKSPSVRLLFDSALQPLAAGVRGSVPARQFLFETDAYCIDLRLEPSPSADRACLVGQVMGREASETADGVVISLRQGRLDLHRTKTNQFGEFQLEFDPSLDISVLVGADEETGVVLPLYGIRKKLAERNTRA
jgi:hypothetical protein